MSNDYFQEASRGPIDVAHFVMGFVGFLTAAAGIVVTTPAIWIIGVLMFGWAVAYFAVN